MRTVGIICEYNPFHNGHLRQLLLARERAGADCALVCLMSGNYVQRGEPAIFPKQLRTEAALRCGADLVLELPLSVALSSAEGFAAGGVSVLSALGCDRLCFGTESENFDALLRSARANLDPAFDDLLRSELETGCSYAAARQLALERLGAGAGLASPNDILAVEYLKALLRQESSMEPLPIHRPNTYHADTGNREAPSASAIRNLLRGEGARPSVPFPWAEGGPKDGMRGVSTRAESLWLPAVPATLHALYAASPIHTWDAGERAVLARVRTLPDEAYAALPYGSEGLWSKLMKACRACASTEEILESVKSKRYSMTRVRRMLLCAFLGLTKADLEAPAPYVRILGFNQKGRTLLRDMKSRFPLVNAGERPADEAYYALECRASDLYSLFSVSGPRPAGEEERQRVVLVSDQK